MEKKSFKHQLGSMLVVFGIASLIIGMFDSSILLWCAGFGLVALLTGFVLRVMG